MIRVEPIERFRLDVADASWEFSNKYRDKIHLHWQAILVERPRLWNGEVLLCIAADIADGEFSATLVRSDYASFIAWRDWGRPDTSVRNCFGVPAVFSSDGALLIGVMNGWTLNAGKAYPPSGTLEPRDIRGDGSIDVRGSMRTELQEETGLDLNLARPGAIVAIFEGHRLAIVQRYDFELTFDEMQRHFRLHQALEPNPELATIEAVWSSSQVDSRMPDYAQEIIRYFIP